MPDHSFAADLVKSASAPTIQAEGICFEKAGKYIFQGNAGERLEDAAQIELAALAAGSNEGPPMAFFTRLHQMMWTSVSERPPIAYNEKQREKTAYNGLNRNTVLHGIALEEYATEENSLKAFSLLSFIAALTAGPKAPSPIENKV